MPATDHTLDDILTLAATHFKVPREKLTPDDDFFKTLKIDSLQALDLLTKLENHFHVELPDYELLPQKIADALGNFYEAVVNKYYVDELYATLFVKPLVDGSTRILWQGVDRKVIDDTVNDTADGARHVSDEVRHMQSGNLRSYAGWIAAGAAVVIAYMVWLGVGRCSPG